MKTDIEALLTSQAFTDAVRKIIVDVLDERDMKFSILIDEEDRIRAEVLAEIRSRKC